MEERGRLPQERRRDDFVHHHRPHPGRVRVRDGAARLQAGADPARRPARIFLRRGRGPGRRSEIGDSLPGLRKLCEGAALLALPNQEALELAAAFAEDAPDGLLDAVPGARTLLLLYDPDELDPDRLDLSRRSEPPPPRMVRLAACYDGEDLDEVARELGLSRKETIRRHVE